MPPPIQLLNMIQPESQGMVAFIAFALWKRQWFGWRAAVFSMLTVICYTSGLSLKRSSGALGLRIGSAFRALQLI
jgi:hypothetical protein